MLDYGVVGWNDTRHAFIGIAILIRITAIVINVGVCGSSHRRRLRWWWTEGICVRMCAPTREFTAATREFTDGSGNSPAARSFARSALRASASFRTRLWADWTARLASASTWRSAARTSATSRAAAANASDWSPTVAANACENTPPAGECPLPPVIARSRRRMPAPVGEFPLQSPNFCSRR
eukprot:1186662-Prorocentrum_minimum.AAC.1